MTDIKQALQSPELMDAYLELKHTTAIIKEIKEYANIKDDVERRKLAAMAMQSLIGKQDILLLTPNAHLKDIFERIGEVAVIAADKLIEALNKQP